MWLSDSSFTCSKASRAPARIGRALASHGLGRLRIDFTGLGDSEGSFGGAGLSGDLADLRSAAAWLSERGTPARILVCLLYESRAHATGRKLVCRLRRVKKSYE